MDPTDVTQALTGSATLEEALPIAMEQYLERGTTRTEHVPIRAPVPDEPRLCRLCALLTSPFNNATDLTALVRGIIRHNSHNLPVMITAVYQTLNHLIRTLNAAENIDVEEFTAQEIGLCLRRHQTGVAARYDQLQKIARALIDGAVHEMSVDAQNASRMATSGTAILAKLPGEPVGTATAAPVSARVSAFVTPESAVEVATDFYVPRYDEYWGPPPRDEFSDGESIASQ